VDLTWLDPDDLDPRDVAGAVALLEAARLADRPDRAGTTASQYAAQLRFGYDGDRPAVALTRDPAGRVTGLLEVWCPHRDNQHLASVHVRVDPLVRRHGLGRALFAAGTDRARAAARRLLLSSSPEGSAGIGFLKAMGLDPVYEEVIRRLDVPTVDWPRLEREYAEATARAGGYELLRVPAPLPAELLDRVATMTAAINDAPTGGLDIEDEVFDPDRIRAYEHAQQAGGRRLYRVIARERTTGTLAGHTVAAVEQERPWWAWQHDTSVVAAHRGHRLGLLLKIEMLRWLLEREPQVRFMDTGNAADNKHMIAVNEALGYQVVSRVIEHQRHL
jgi:RimJ/RimL family protein N-acetyltransferase